MRNARLLVQALREPESVRDCDWAGLISAARAEQLIGSLAFRMEGRELPPRVAATFEAARWDAAQARTQALWEAEMARRALAPRGVPVVLLKGTAFHAAGLDASIGRSVGDLDILVPRASLREVELALIEAGWERVKQADGYDDLYYRRWMHELPPLIHRTRDRMIDVHHTILPATAKPKPDAPALTRRASRSRTACACCRRPTWSSCRRPPVRDGDIGRTRNLWDIDRLLREFAAADTDSSATLRARATAPAHAAVNRAARLAHDLYGTPFLEAGGPRRRGPPSAPAARAKRWGQETRKLSASPYLRSHC